MLAELLSSGFERSPRSDQVSLVCGSITPTAGPKRRGWVHRHCPAEQKERPTGIILNLACADEADLMRSKTPGTAVAAAAQRRYGTKYASTRVVGTRAAHRAFDANDPAFLQSFFQDLKTP